jgi:flagellar basal-body rod protein FlgB
MALNLDSYLGVHAQALTLEAQRTELLAANLANADTPNYKARDIDFKAALAAASGGSVNSGGSHSTGTLPVATTNAVHLSGQSAEAADAASGSSDLSSNLKYRVPMAPALDGNTVDTQLEQAAFAENSVRYQATLTFLNARLKELMTAITGQ